MSNVVATETDFRLLAAKYLRRERGLKFVLLLGKGSYGTVIQMRSDDLGDVAVKMVSRKLANSLEIQHWQNFNHPNILRLLLVDQTQPSCVIFVTELMSQTLTKHLQNKVYCERPEAISNNKRYIREVLLGLEYLHGRHFCHLDVRADNVFLSYDGRAVLADFSGLCSASEKKNFCPLPRCFRPPEMLKDKKNIWPRPIDLWSFGLLAAYIFFLKKFYKVVLLQGQVGTVECAKNYVETFRNPENVVRAVEKNYPFSKVSPNFSSEFTSFVSQFLHSKPKRRSQASEALYHSFLMPAYVCHQRPTPDPSLPGCSSSMARNCDTRSIEAHDFSASTEASSDSSKSVQQLLPQQSTHRTGNQSCELNRKMKSSGAFPLTEQSNPGKPVIAASDSSNISGTKHEEFVSDNVLVENRKAMTKSPDSRAQPRSDEMVSCYMRPDAGVSPASTSCESLVSQNSKEFLMRDKTTSTDKVVPNTRPSAWRRFRNRLRKLKDMLFAPRR